MMASRFSPTDRSVLGFLTVLLVAGVVLTLYKKNSRPVSPALLISVTEVPAGRFAKSTPKNQSPAFSPVDLNRAGADELERLPGLGPALAERILEYREKKGTFKTVQELLRVPGIGPKKLAQIQSKVYVPPGAGLSGDAAQGRADHPSKTIQESSMVPALSDER